MSLNFFPQVYITIYRNWIGTGSEPDMTSIYLRRRTAAAYNPQAASPSSAYIVSPLTKIPDASCREDLKIKTKTDKNRKVTAAITGYKTANISLGKSSMFRTREKVGEKIGI